MELHLYNTRSKRKQAIRPFRKGELSMYVCGPTVYNYAHIGNARSAVVFDLLYRFLSLSYPKLRYARNITDIDDKILQRAAVEQESWQGIAERYTQCYREDMAALAVLPPTYEPKATDHIEDMIAVISRLVDRGHAYISDGHVLFHSPSYEDYGCLANRNRETLYAGARVQVEAYKKDASDFVLWKPGSQSNSDAKTRAAWPSPWGWGRPGWHTECSAMIHHYFESHVDIHGGGQDLIFPHHENEIAQSYCAYDKAPCAYFWMHNGFVRNKSEKMSKSLGNILLVRELLSLHSGLSLRLALLSTHYRAPLDWDTKRISLAQKNLERFYAALSLFPELYSETQAGSTHTLSLTELPSDFSQALADDLNISAALATLHKRAGELESHTAQPQKQKKIAQELLDCLRVLGLDPKSEVQMQQSRAKLSGLTQAKKRVPVEEVESILGQRMQARQAKDYALADQLRKRLEAQGVCIQDRQGQTNWSYQDEP